MSFTGMRFDAALNAAVLEAEALDLAAIPEAAELERDYPPSSPLDARLNRILKKEKNAQRLWRTARFFKKIAACLVITLAAAACAFLPVKAVREAVFATLVEWQDQFARFTFSSDSGNGGRYLEEIGIDAGDLPDGYMLVYEHRDSLSYSAVFSNDESSYIHIDIQLVDDSQNKYFDNEYTSFYWIEVLDNKLQWMPRHEGDNLLLWNDHGLVYVINSSEPLNICIEVAKKFM